MRSRPLAVEQEAAELVLQELDGARERRLRHVAFLGRAGEIQLLAQGEEIPDLMHFHGDNLSVHRHVPATLRPAHAQPVVAIAAGFHFDKPQLDWPRIARVTKMSSLDPCPIGIGSGVRPHARMLLPNHRDSCHVATRRRLDHCGIGRAVREVTLTAAPRGS